MANGALSLTSGRPLMVGSFGSIEDLQACTVAQATAACDLVEIRLDRLGPAPHARDWAHLQGIPRLFTARREDEGGAMALTAAERMRRLRLAMDDAACVDIEVASIDEMAALLPDLVARGIPWIASYHDFQKLPATQVMVEAARCASDAGASAFKLAAQMTGPSDLARLAEFQLSDHPLPVATMGMGPLATVSRLLCAQCGSVLNYGFLGTTATAPGQWQIAQLKHAAANLEPWRANDALG